MRLNSLVTVVMVFLFTTSCQESYIESNDENEDIDDFSCDFKDSLCEWSNKHPSKIGFSLWKDIKDNGTIPSNFTDEDCAVLYRRDTGGSETLKAAIISKQSLSKPSVMQFDLYLTSNAEILVDVEYPQAQLVYASTITTERDQWIRAQEFNKDRLNSIPSNQTYNIIIKVEFKTFTDTPFVAIKNLIKLSTTTTPSSYNETVTDNTPSVTPTRASTNQNPTETATNQNPTETATNQNPTETATNQNPTETATNQNPTETTVPESTSGNPLSTKQGQGFEFFLRNIGWKKVLLMILFCFFGTLLLAFAYEVGMNSYCNRRKEHKKLAGSKTNYLADTIETYQNNQFATKSTANLC